MTVGEDVRRVLDSQWRTASEIHKMIGQWSQATVADRLVELHEEGAADRRMLPFKGRSKRAFYRRTQWGSPSEMSRPLGSATTGGTGA